VCYSTRRAEMGGWWSKRAAHCRDAERLGSGIQLDSTMGCFRKKPVVVDVSVRLLMAQAV